MSDIVYPPEQVFSPKIEKKDFELIILWMLNNNDSCEWSDFTKPPLEFRLSTLSKYLSILKSKGFVDNYARGHYKIKQEGKKRFHEKIKVTSKKKKLNYPPRVITMRRNYDHWILWMVYNNNYCKWSSFLEPPLSINQSSLSKTLNLLIDQNFIKKDENKEYRITRSGKIEYSNMLQTYDLDRQSILDDETKRIEDVTIRTTDFFNKYNIEGEDIQFRFLSNVLKLDYTRVEKMLIDEEDFDKIVLFISMNHPDQYPDYVSTEEFSTEYEIEIETLNYYVLEIVDKQFLQIKFFKLTIPPDSHYYFQENERLEIILRAITEDYITKYTYLNKLFSRTVDLTSTINQILVDACDILFDSGLKDSVKEFLPKYIKYLAFKIEAKKEFKEENDKLEGIIWQDIPEIFQLKSSEILKDQYEEEIKKFNVKIKKDPENLDLYNSKLSILIYYNQYDDVLELLDEMFEIFPEKEKGMRMKKASILRTMKELDAGLNIINDLSEKYPEDNDLLNYKAYWLQYLGEREEALEIIQDLVDRIPDNGMYHDTYGEILMYFEEYEEAIEEFQTTLELVSEGWYIYQTHIKLGICYKELEMYDLAKENLLKGKSLTSEQTFDPETQQKWVAIADLFILQIEQLL